MAHAATEAIVHRLLERGYNVAPAAAARIAGADDPERILEAVLASVSEDVLCITPGHVEAAIDNPLVSGGDDTNYAPRRARSDRPVDPIGIVGDVTGQSTCTGEYGDFVALFRDRYDQLAGLLRGRITHRNARSLADARGGSEVGMIGMVADVRSTRNGHWLVELEDPTGAFPALLMSDRDIAADAQGLLYDEVIGVSGRLSDDAGIIFVEDLYLPDVPRTFEPNTADRHVQAALISDVHVGSKEFLAEAWDDFSAWLHSPEAEPVEYLVIAGDMVEGVGVYPGQEHDLAIEDVYAQYRRFAELLKQVPGDLEIVMIPGNHDAVRLAEPQPAFTDEIADILAVHDAHITANPSTVSLEGVNILVYHGASLDEVIASVPDEDVAYANPDRAMAELLRKRHVAPQYGGRIRIAPEERDYLVIEDVPDVFHTGHVHTIGVGTYHGVRLINSGCWQAQTDFQRRNNLDPDPGFAPIIDLDTLDVKLRKFV